MGNLLRSELYKLRKEPSFRLLGAVFVLLAIALSLLIHFLSPDKGGYTGLAGLDYALQMNVLVMKIALAVIGGFFISAEHGSGIMKLSAASGYSRLQVYAAKLTAYSLGIVALSLLLPAACTAAGWLLNGFGSLPAGEGSGLAYLWRSAGLTALYAAAFAAIVAGFAVVTRLSGVTIGVALLGLLFFDSISLWLGSLWTFYQTVYEHSVFKLFLDIPEFRHTAGEWQWLVWAPVATLLVFAFVGMAAFRKMEVK